VDILIEAFTIFNRRHGGSYALHVVGIRPEELPPDLQAAREDVRFYGYLDRTVAGDRDLYNNLIRSARLFVFPTRPGPVAGVIREAQLNCTPVIISSVPGASERVAHDHNGILVESLEPEDFARHMDALVTDTPRWRRYAQNAHLSIKDGTWSTTAQNFLQIAEASGLTRG
jgi:glycosyltransferase involved in cell wall biosynthesis